MNLAELRGKLDGLITSILDEENIQVEQKPPGTIHHYTSAAGLRGILENQCIWATHAHYLNDASERKYGETLVGNLLDETFRPLGPDRSNRWVKGDDGTIKAPPEIASKYTLLFESFTAVKSDIKNDVYVTSFCLAENLLSQWRAYGRQGGGYSIEFAIESGVCRVDGGGEFGTFKVLYDPATQRRITNKIVSRMLESFDQHLGEILKVDWLMRQSATYNEHLYALVDGLLTVGLRFKDPGFGEEQEWRFFATKNPDDVDGVKFREQEGLLVPYVELPLAEGWITIRSIRCGPTLHPELAERSVKMLLAKHGMVGVPVHTSEIPLRA